VLGWVQLTHGLDGARVKEINFISLICSYWLSG
jgi:hypothetical protein